MEKEFENFEVEKFSHPFTGEDVFFVGVDFDEHRHSEAFFKSEEEAKALLKMLASKNRVLLRLKKEGYSDSFFKLRNEILEYLA